MACNLMCCSTVFQPYKNDEKVIMKGCGKFFNVQSERFQASLNMGLQDQHARA